MKLKLEQLGRQLGVIGLVAAVGIVATVVFQLGVVSPLEEKAARLEEQGGARQPVAAKGADPRSPVISGSRIGEFYRFFETGERIEDSLARISGIAAAAGLQLRAADYRLSDPRAGLERYEISLPVQGTYSQIRLFLETCLRELPTLSLDRTVLRRKSANDARIDAEIVMTLHRLKQ